MDEDEQERVRISNTVLKKAKLCGSMIILLLKTAQQYLCAGGSEGYYSGTKAIQPYLFEKMVEK